MKPNSFLRASAAAGALVAWTMAPLSAQQAQETQQQDGQVAPALTVSDEAAAAGGAIIHVSAADIWEMQRELNARGFDAGPIDGIVGESTIAAVCALQMAEGLEATGNINTETLAALDMDGVLQGEDAAAQEDGEDGSFDAAAAAIAGEGGGGAPFYVSPAVLRNLQLALNSAGFVGGTGDGRWSDEFGAALASFQQAEGLPATGTLTLATLERLGDQQEEQEAGQQMMAAMSMDECMASGMASLADGPAPGAFGAPLYLGPENVREIQLALNAQGLNAGAVDGIVGPDLQGAVQSFQQANQLAATGTLDTRVLAVMSQEVEALGGVLEPLQMAAGPDAAENGVEDVQPTAAPGPDAEPDAEPEDEDAPEVDTDTDNDVDDNGNNTENDD